MIVGTGGRVFGGNMDLSDKLVCEEAKDKNRGVCRRYADIQTLYSCREDGGFQ